MRVRDPLARSLPAGPGRRAEPKASYVVERSVADQRGLEYDFVAAWITLTARSAFDVVGLTATVSQALADAGISCNVIAGRFHDHLLVPYDRADDALQVLDALTR